MKIIVTLVNISMKWQFLRIMVRSEKRHHLFSLTLPVSITNITSGMVMPVSAMLVASTIFLVPAGGTVNAWLWSAELSTECNATTLYLYKRSKKTMQIHTDTQSYCHFWCYLFLWYGIRMSRQGGDNIKFLLFQQDFDAMYVSLFLKHKTFYW